ncbi:ATP-binding cassette domain-containing protein [Clostridium sp. MCC353]|uniref:ABC transporter ATP-binding protein n=1 Tax=Clostridium sp. MCC353 TaxID=2592646 RepID=UPI001C039AD4|nr:ABC transporter ATP-binding protein [Clostridium sp. MCC353]MBT9778075.1 ATP-binding cassette domain-containing protein [Clostridium sp. MCC353]
MSVSIKIEHAVKKYGDKVIIPDLSLNIRQGEFFTLLGSSGCGKTTLLRMIAGFNTIEGGSFYFNDKLINHLPPYNRNIGMVFQNYAVFPHMTAEKNVGYGLKQRKIKDPEYSKRVNDILDVVQIAGLKDRLPSDMSGGQQQRIALARAIVIQPDVLLMDEPLSNLDAKLRVEMRLAIKNIQNQYKITTLYVTHDQEEALSMSDRIAVMNKGVIQQIGTPVEVYCRPSNLFVATFIGQSNLFDCEVVKRGTQTFVKFFDGSEYQTSRLTSSVNHGQKVKAVIRPTELSFQEKGIRGEVEENIFLGTEMRYIIRMADGSKVEISQDIKKRMRLPGDQVTLGFDMEEINLFDMESGDSLMKDVKKHE